MDPSAAFRVVVIGATKPESVRRVIAGFPAKPGFAAMVSCSGLEAKELQPISKLPVIDVTSSIDIVPDRVFVLPHGGTPRFKAGQLVVDRSEVTPAPVDSILRAVADEAGRFGVGVLLDDGTADGTVGIKRMKESGGLTIAETNAGRGDGLIDLVVPLEDIPRRLLAFVRSDEQRLVPELDDAAGGDTLRDILSFVRVRSGHDFASYKRATLHRRIARRMQVCGCDTIADYHNHLRNHPTEIGSLLRDFLISVTNFFRDAEAFAALGSDIIPKLFANKSPHDQLRVWIAGCASGEEAYSIAILLLEHAGRLRDAPHLQVFATDIDDASLADARLGCYPETIAADVSRDRLERFFLRENDQYRVSKELREVVLFSPHNVLRDPPFSRLDLISCRNLLIYLNRDAQNRVLTMFHFGLRPEGFLFLGSSESAENSTIFGPVDMKARVFVRRAASTSLGEALTPAARWSSVISVPHPPAHDRGTPVGELHHRVVEKYAPPSVLVNHELDIVHVSEHAGKYLAVAGGEPTRQLLRLIHPALRLDLRTALYTARTSGNETRVVRFDDGGPRAVELRVRSVSHPELGGGSLLVMFDELAPDAHPAQGVGNAAIEPVVREMEEELHRTRDQLRTTIEQYETSVEELKASNEELQAINEELRSATEELETSKEELQSVNEELTTLNHELKVKIDEISHANSDLQNLIGSTDIGVVFLDRQLRIKRFTPRVQDLFNVIASDIGRPLSDLTNRLDSADLNQMARSVLDTLRIAEQRVTSRDHHRYYVRALPYRSIDDHIDGVVLTFVDVSDLRDAIDARDRSEAALEKVEERLRVTLLAAPIAILSYDARLELVWAYVAGRELEVRPGTPPSMFSAASTERLATCVRQASMRRHRDQVELEVLLDGQPHLFDFRIEPTTAGVTVVGFDLHHDRR